MEHGHMPTPADSMYNNSMTTMHDMVMHMSFFWGKDVTVLFQGWPGHSPGMYVLALIFVFLLALAVEVLSVFLSGAAAAAKTPSLATSFIHSAVYALRMALAYMVMLSIMSFNLGVFIVAVAGHTAGYLLLQFRKLAAAHRTAHNSSIEQPKV